MNSMHFLSIHSVLNILADQEIAIMKGEYVAQEKAESWLPKAPW